MDGKKIALLLSELIILFLFVEADFSPLDEPLHSPDERLKEDSWKPVPYLANFQSNWKSSDFEPGNVTAQLVEETKDLCNFTLSSSPDLYMLFRPYKPNKQGKLVCPKMVGWEFWREAKEVNFTYLQRGNIRSAGSILFVIGMPLNTLNFSSASGKLLDLAFPHSRVFERLQPDNVHQLVVKNLFMTSYERTGASTVHTCQLFNEKLTQLESIILIHDWASTPTTQFHWSKMICTSIQVENSEGESEISPYKFQQVRNYQVKFKGWLLLDTTIMIGQPVESRHEQVEITFERAPTNEPEEQVSYLSCKEKVLNIRLIADTVLLRFRRLRFKSIEGKPNEAASHFYKCFNYEKMEPKERKSALKIEMDFEQFLNDASSEDKLESIKQLISRGFTMIHRRSGSESDAEAQKGSEYRRHAFTLFCNQPPICHLFKIDANLLKNIVAECKIEGGKWTVNVSSYLPEELAINSVCDGPPTTTSSTRLPLPPPNGIEITTQTPQTMMPHNLSTASVGLDHSDIKTGATGGGNETTGYQDARAIKFSINLNWAAYSILLLAATGAIFYLYSSFSPRISKPPASYPLLTASIGQPSPPAIISSAASTSTHTKAPKSSSKGLHKKSISAGSKAKGCLPAKLASSASKSDLSVAPKSKISAAKVSEKVPVSKKDEAVVKKGPNNSR